jgi:hypothetical protein
MRLPRCIVILLRRSCGAEGLSDITTRWNEISGLLSHPSELLCAGNVVPLKRSGGGDTFRLADNSLGRPLGLPCRSSAGCLDCVVVNLLLMHGCGRSVGPLCNFDSLAQHDMRCFFRGRVFRASVAKFNDVYVRE